MTHHITRIEAPVQEIHNGTLNYKIFFLFKRNGQNIFFSYKYTVKSYDLVLYKYNIGNKKDLTLKMTDLGIFSAKMTSDSR
jgi:hypothetical protein